MKKKFILWLCKLLKVDLVDPFNQINQVHLVHELVPYSLIQDVVRINKYALPPNQLTEIIDQAEREMVLRCVEKLEPDILRWDRFEDPMNGIVNIKCSFYAARNQ